MTIPCAKVERIVLGMISNNVYAISDDTSMVLIDPSCEPQKILEFLDGRIPDAIIITHAHFDHIGALAHLHRETGAPVYVAAEEVALVNGEKPLLGINRKIEPCEVDVALADGDAIVAGTMTLQVMHTPGHSPGSMCFYIDGKNVQGAPEESMPILISGDTLFEGCIGRTDFEGGSMQEMKESLRRLATLPDETLVLPGHGNATTIAAERGRVFARY